MEKTLAEIAEATWVAGDGWNWQAVADAVVAAREARRWKAIDSAGVPPLLVGKWHRGKWTWKQTELVAVAKEDGYTHWTPIPAPPKEAEHGR